MSTEVHPPFVEEAREKIESALQAEDDQGLYREWRLLPLDIRHQVADAVASALTILDEEKKEQARRKRRAKARKWYWKEQKRIQEQLERIAGCPEISILAKITFRNFEECLCPHGWNWTYCESLGQRLLSLREAKPDASSTSYGWRNSGRRTSTQRRLAWEEMSVRLARKVSPPRPSAPPHRVGVRPKLVNGPRYKRLSLA
jgi:hypothetical protein